MKKNKNYKVSIVMGSQSDYKVMKLAKKSLKILVLSLKLKSFLLIEPRKECMTLLILLQKIILV